LKTITAEYIVIETVII